jgi:hypothetical protein
MNGETDTQARTRSAGQVVFVTVALALTLFLLSRITAQTVWVEGARSLAAQPRFWPGVALGTMAAGLGLHLWRMRRRRPDLRDWTEVRRWAEPLEYALWFMAYVYTVPIVGFLPMSLVFACALTWRLGYRSRLTLAVAALFAVATVVVFKGFLGVKIPGAALYEILPGATRSFFLTYL